MQVVTKGGGGGAPALAGQKRPAETDLEEEQQPRQGSYGGAPHRRERSEMRATAQTARAPGWSQSGRLDFIALQGCAVAQQPGSEYPLLAGRWRRVQNVEMSWGTALGISAGWEEHLAQGCAWVGATFRFPEGERLIAVSARMLRRGLLAHRSAGDQIADRVDDPSDGAPHGRPAQGLEHRVRSSGWGGRPPEATATSGGTHEVENSICERSTAPSASRALGARVLDGEMEGREAQA